MANIPAELRYTKDHEYVKQTGDGGVMHVGITDYAQGELGDVVYVDLPKVGASFGRGDVFGTIEAVKAVSELYAPLSGTVTEVNAALQNDPAPYGSRLTSAGSFCSAAFTSVTVPESGADR